MPEFFCKAIGSFYVNNKNFLKIDGDIFGSFTARAGVRQGCPMSPVLFALALDPFLDYLCRQLPHACMVRGYADDTAIVLPDLSLLSRVTPAYELLSKAAALHINVGKTICVPWYPTTHQQANRNIQFCDWRGMSVEIGCSKYLGFFWWGPKPMPKTIL